MNLWDVTSSIYSQSTSRVTGIFEMKFEQSFEIYMSISNIANKILEFP